MTYQSQAKVLLIEIGKVYNEADVKLLEDALFSAYTQGVSDATDGAIDILKRKT